MKNKLELDIEIKNKLLILPPTEFVSSNSILNFERYRELSINWYDLFDDTKQFFDPLSDFKRYINRQWGGEEFAQEAFYKSSEYWRVANVCFFNKLQECLYAENVYCIVHKNSRKLFIFLDSKGLPISTNSIAFDTLQVATGKTEKQGYNFFWSEIQNLAKSFIIAYEVNEDEILAGGADGEPVGVKIETKNRLKNYLPYSIPVKRDFLYYSEEYERLNTQLEFYDIVQEKVKSKRDILIDNITINFDKESIEDLLEEKAQNYSNLRSKSFEVKEKIRILSQKLKNIGYYLADGIENNTEITLPNGVKLTLEKGQVYRQFRDIFRWTTEESYQVEVGVSRNFFNQVTARYYETRVRQIPHEAVTDLFEKVSFSVDPVSAYQNKLTLEGKMVITAILKKQGFFTQDNIPLNKILEKCDNDENYRLNCVIVIPEYDFILSNKTYKTGAIFYHNPLPSIISKRLPSIGFMEHLSYKISWFGSELGHIIGSINLAPGETREVNESSKFSLITTQSLTTKSIFESNIADSSDFASEFQNEASKEMTKSESLSASASGSYGPISGSASGSVNTSLKTFTRDMSKIAKKVSNSINRKNNQESFSSSTSTTSSENNDSKKISLTNVNLGSTLNLFLYQINNKFKSGLFVNDLEFHLAASKELIQGSDLYEHYSYKLQDFGFFFEDLYDKLPFILSNDEELNFVKKIILLIDESFGEYQIKSDENSSNENIILKFENSDESLDENLSSEELYKNFVSKMKSKIIDDSLNVLADVLIMPSKALYLDAKVGINPATEPYTERMRNLESLKVENEVNKQAIINTNLKLKNSVIQNGGTFITNISTFEKVNKNESNESTSISIIELSKKVDTEITYEIVIDEKLKSNYTLECINNGMAFLINWNFHLEEITLDSLMIVSSDKKIIITQ